MKIKVSFLQCVYFFLFFSANCIIGDTIVFDNPLEKNTYITGGFGEFRGNHFHSGIDISTLGNVGWRVHSPVDGYVSRIKVSSFGFGKAIYITTKNLKYILVFAHLKGFRKDVDRYIRRKQIESGSFELDISFDRGREVFFVKKGDVIGYSGDTGGVFPHLHFEVRNSKNEPIFFTVKGLNEDDSEPPVLKRIMIRPIGSDSFIDGYNDVRFFDLEKVGENKYVIKGRGCLYVNGKIGVSVYGFDKSKGNKIGLIGANVFDNGRRVFDIAFRHFSYNDYKKVFFVYSRLAYMETGKGFLNLFKRKDFHYENFPFYGRDIESGLINVDKETHKVSINVYDLNGNVSLLEFNIKPYQGKYFVKNRIDVEGKSIVFYSPDELFCKVEADGKVFSNKLNRRFWGYFYSFDASQLNGFSYCKCSLYDKSGKKIKQKSFYLGLLRKKRDIFYKSGRYMVKVRKSGVFFDKAFYIEKRKIEKGSLKNGLISKGDAFFIGPRGVSFSKSIFVGVKERISKNGIFRNLFNNWDFLGAKVFDGSYLAAKIDGASLLGVLYDNISPLVKFEKKEGKKYYFRVEDKESGIDYKKCRVLLNGEKIPFEFILRKKLVCVDLSGMLFKNKQIKQNVLNLKIFDNVGNCSEKNIEIFD